MRRINDFFFPCTCVCNLGICTFHSKHNWTFNLRASPVASWYVIEKVNEKSCKAGKMEITKIVLRMAAHQSLCHSNSNYWTTFAVILSPWLSRIICLSWVTDLHIGTQFINSLNFLPEYFDIAMYLNLLVFKIVEQVFVCSMTNWNNNKKTQGNFCNIIFLPN